MNAIRPRLLRFVPRGAAFLAAGGALALFVAALAPAAGAFTLPAGDPVAQGLAIAEEVDARDLGFENFTATMTMVLSNRQGQKSERELRVRTLEMTDDGDKSLVIFDSPRDVKGTAFLSYSHKTGNDDQWLYLPALKRVKRIASNNKSGPFMGSEFAYEDISSQEVEKYSYKYLHEETLDGMSCYVVERYPVDENSGYTRQIVWIDQEEFRVWKVVFHDRKDSLLKTLTYHGYQQYADQHWRPDRMFVENHQTGKSTDLIWRDYAFKTDLEEKDFEQNALKRVR
jgi:outer membrane lipoprotein-sorting protein